MSHRVTYKVETTDRDLVIEALKLGGMSYREEGNHIRVTSGPFNHATINLTTGEISGDTDYRHSEEGLAAFRQNYGEAKCLYDFAKQGVTVESRAVERHFNEECLVLYCNQA